MNNKLYQQELNEFISKNPLEFLNRKSVMITGASGLIGSYLVDVIMKKNELLGNKTKVYAVVRNYEKAMKRFNKHINEMCFELVKADVSKQESYDFDVDYIIHAASNANPKAFDSDPIGTIEANVKGTLYLLNYAKDKDANFLYLSSSEVYGEPIKKNTIFKEDEMGIVNPLLPRSCYTESKRVSENICVNYSKQYGVHTNIARIGFAYGATFTEKDNRVIPQFIRSGLNDDFIVMKSSGSLVRSYIYIYDVASGIFKILEDGKDSETYNIANSNSNVSIREIAESVSKSTGKEIKYDLPELEIKKGYAPFSAGLISANKLESLGWVCRYPLTDGISQIVDILKIGRDIL